MGAAEPPGRRLPAVPHGGRRARAHCRAPARPMWGEDMAACSSTRARRTRCSPTRCSAWRSPPARSRSRATPSSPSAIPCAARARPSTSRCAAAGTPRRWMRTGTRSRRPTTSRAATLAFHHLKHKRGEGSLTVRGQAGGRETKYVFADTPEHYRDGDTRTLRLIQGDTRDLDVLLRPGSVQIMAVDLPYGVQHRAGGSPGRHPAAAGEGRARVACGARVGRRAGGVVQHLRDAACAGDPRAGGRRL